MILKNAKIMDDTFTLVDACLSTEGERIADIAPDLHGEEEIDLTGCVVVPGFVDIHIHACVGADTCDASTAGLAKMAAHLVTKGVTSFCPTTMTVSHEEIEDALATVKACMDDRPFGAAIMGVNMEGPYISINKKGAQKGEYVKNPNWEEFKGFYDGCGGIIKPDVVLYEEGLDQGTLEAAVRALAEADMLMIGGTSLNVYPAAGLIRYYQGHKLVLLNKSPVARDLAADLVITDPIGETLAQL